MGDKNGNLRRATGKWNAQLELVTIREGMTGFLEQEFTS